MRVAALYDVHAMVHALEAVLADVERERVEAIVFGGDVFDGPFPRETLELVRGIDGARFVRGNCERDPAEWVREQLGAEAVAASLAWPATIELDGVLYCHATPASDERILTQDSPDERFDAALAGDDHRLVVAGHTHVQFRRGRFANAGSVGMPYEGDVAAFWAVIGEDVDFRRTAFDVERAIREIGASGWPGREEFVAENLRSAPSRREAIEHFERVA
jgi:predicted phosphodiesterase